MLKAIQGVGWEYGDIVPDYQVGSNTCVLYLRYVPSLKYIIPQRVLTNPLIRYSLKYHRLHPEYLHTRIEAIRGTYLLRVLLLMCDIVSQIRSRYMVNAYRVHRQQSEHQEPIREITKICLINEITVITAWR